MNKLTTYIALGFATLAASCSSDLGDSGSATLSGNGEKTPLEVNASLNTLAPQSRATNNKFDGGDKLLAYVRHVTWDGVIPGTKSQVEGEFAKRLVTFTFGSAQVTTADKSTTTDLTAEGTPLYWDDFSSSTTADTDLRTEGHYLQSYYGYCYNGGTPSTALNSETGVLGWSVPKNQTTAEAVKTSDLLWSAEQEPVSYMHSTAIDADHNTITIPYTHAMSEVTIIVKVDKGYEGAALNDAAVTLKNFNNVGTFTAPSQEIGTTSAADIIKMYAGAVVDKSKTFVAMTVPQTNLTAGNVLATITNVNGTNYDIPVTAAILESWKSQLVEDEAGEKLNDGVAEAKPMLLSRATATIDPAKGYLTKPGVNYELTVTISKVDIKVEASIADWKTVKATGTGAVNFSADIKTTDKENTITAGSFDIFHATTTAGLAYSTTATYTGGKWVNTPDIYWADGSTTYFFRALASYDGTKPSSVSHSLSAAQGIDLIWATTPAHKGKEADGTEHDYEQGAAINPRTGEVPMEFEHIMSKVTMKLETSEVEAAKVDLTGAKISISNLSTAGTIAISDGAITPSTSNAAAITNMAAPINGYCVIPQTIADKAIVTITLADGTTYKLQLNKCTDSTGEVTEWQRGKHYTYTIYLEKEKITFRAMIKDWDEKTGSGNATLEWD